MKKYEDYKKDNNTSIDWVIRDLMIDILKLKRDLKVTGLCIVILSIGVFLSVFR